MEDSADTGRSKNPIFGCIFLFLALGFILFYLFVIVAIYRLSKTNFIFILFCSHAVASISALSQFMWLSIEILSNKKLPISNQLSTFVCRLCLYTVHLNLILIAINRAHALFSPVKFNQLWTAKFTMLSGLSCWIISLTTCIWTLLIVDTDPAVFTGHSIESFYFEDYSLYNYSLKGAIFHNFMSTYIFSVLSIIGLLIYIIALVKLLSERYGKKHSLLSSQVQRQVNRRCQLFLQCFITFLPSLVLFFQPLLLSLPTPYNFFIITMSAMNISAIEPFILVGLNKMVRQNLPFFKKTKNGTDFTVNKVVILSDFRTKSIPRF